MDHIAKYVSAGMAGLLVVLLSSAPAAAWTRTQIGTGVSQAYVYNQSGEHEFAVLGKMPEGCDDFDAGGVIEYTGDIVFVKDGCSDGRSAIVLIEDFENGNKRICRNSRGAGTWAKCDFDWPEGNVRQVAVAGWYNGSTGNMQLWWSQAVYFGD